MQNGKVGLGCTLQVHDQMDWEDFLRPAAGNLKFKDPFNFKVSWYE
jgi:hypothetical protein